MDKYTAFLRLCRNSGISFLGKVPGKICVTPSVVVSVGGTAVGVSVLCVPGAAVGTELKEVMQENLIIAL